MNDIHAIRTHLALNERLRHELQDAVSRVLKSHGIQFDERILDNATVGTEDELVSRSLEVAGVAPPAVASAGYGAWSGNGYGYAYGYGAGSPYLSSYLHPYPGWYWAGYRYSSWAPGR